MIDPRARLRQMIGDLRYYRREREEAKERGDEKVVESMGRMIRTECAWIR